MAELRPQPKWHERKNDGTPYSGGQLFFYEAGTTTKRNTFSDAAKTTTNTNPVVLDSNGEANIWLDGSYKVVFAPDTDTDPPTAPIYTVDNYTSPSTVVTPPSINLITDGSFEIDDNADGIPDKWDVTLFTDGVQTLDTSDQSFGLTSIKFTSVGTGGGYATSQYFEVSPDVDLLPVVSLKSSVADVKNLVDITWYTSAKVTISTTNLYTDATTNPTSWTRKTFAITTPPSTARYAKIKITGCDSSDVTIGSTWFDNISVYAAEYVAGVIADGNLQGQNTIINGDFDIWQRGISFTSAANNAYTSDRWRVKYVTSAVTDILLNNLTPTQTESGHKSNYSMQVDVTTADTSVAATDYYYLRYAVEGYDYKQFEGNTGTLSFWVYGTKTGTHCVQFRNSGGDRVYIAEYTINASNTWEKKTISVDFDYSGGTWDYVTGVGLQLGFMLMVGSNFHGTANIWNTSNVFSTSNQVNVLDNITNNFLISQVKFELGSTATAFSTAGANYAEELAMCQRYYRRLGQGLNGSAYATTNIILNGSFKEMRTAPTVTILDTTVDIATSGTTFASTGSTILFSILKDNGIFVQIGGFTGLTVGDGVGAYTQDDLIELETEP